MILYFPLFKSYFKSYPRWCGEIGTIFSWVSNNLLALLLSLAWRTNVWFYNNTVILIRRSIPIREENISQNADDLKYWPYIFSFCLLGAPNKSRFSGWFEAGQGTITFTLSYLVVANRNCPSDSLWNCSNHGWVGYIIPKWLSSIQTSWKNKIMWRHVQRWGHNLIPLSYPLLNMYLKYQWVCFFCKISLVSVP